MQQIEKIKLLNKAEEMVSEDKYFYQPQIEFVLVSKNRKRFIIGVYDMRTKKKYIYKPQSFYVLTSYEEIEYRYENCRNVFHECIEGYILSCLNGSYEPIMLNINRHIELWTFLDDYLYEASDIFTKGVNKYLEHCIDFGITQKLLESYGKTTLNNIIWIYKNLK